MNHAVNPSHPPSARLDGSYDALTVREQIAVHRRAAHQILSRYALDIARVRVVNHGFNTTFKVVEHNGAEYALRINVNSLRSIDQIRGEVTWVEALAAHGGVQVPRPVRTRDGEPIVVHDDVALGKPVAAVLYTWLAGRNIEDGWTRPNVRALAELTAALHSHVETWQPSSSAVFSNFDSPLLDSVNHLGSDSPFVPSAAREVIETAMATTSLHFRSALARVRPMLVHGDLHGANLKWHGGALAVFDFDDCGVCVPAYDLATSAYYIRDNLRLERELVESYANRREIGVTDAEFESLVASRNLVILNDLLVTTNAEFLDLLPRYTHNTVVRLRHFLETGVYRHDVTGIVGPDEWDQS